MAVIRNVFLTLAAVGVVGVLVAQENAAPPATPAPPASPPVAREPPAPQPVEAPELPGDESDDTFIPTQELGADEQVTFPVDI